ncbi:MAG: FAD-binding oxidoreductase [Halioglobus sp.]|nr:FAD-binding oxidoreductase [Halioglobus sp.]
MDNALLSSLQDIVGSERVLTDANSLQHYGTDWTSLYAPDPAAVLLPDSAAQVQAIVQLAVTRNVAIVPSGGRTGLSGGAVARKGELILALDRLDTIDAFNRVDRTVRCGAGVLTAQLQAFAMQRGLSYPVDFAASGSSRIGGNIATNAGGIRVIRHGMTRDWVAGVKLVDGRGELLDLNKGLVKNNTGYDLRHLVIGAEGTLGIVVEATMRLAEAQPATAVMLLATPDIQSITQVFDTCRDTMALTAFEFFSEAAMLRVLAQGDRQRPLERPAPFYALLEFELSDSSARDVALSLYEDCVSRGWVQAGVISQSDAQKASLWRLREDITETIARWTPYKNDISTVTSRSAEFLAEIDAVVTAHYPGFEIIWFGHIGDGNVHLNILKPEDMPADTFHRRCEEVSQSIFAVVQRFGGSISAEHGVGLVKKNDLHFSRSELEIDIMRQIKKAFDPHSIMNPGKIFDT